MAVIEVSHPVVSDSLAHLRDGRTGPVEFRMHLRRAATALICEAARDLPLARVSVDTPFGSAECRVLADPHPVAVPVLRAGLGMLGAFLDLFPSASVGFIGLYRDENTFAPHEYYHSLPEKLSGRAVFVLDPMLATGGSLLASLALLKAHDASLLRAVTLVAAPEGVKAVEGRFPEVPVYTAAIDIRLNDKAYIVPGIGDAGDRIFGSE